MSKVLAVDLAAKYSAACLMNDSYEVLHEVDSWGCSESDFIWEITRFWDFRRRDDSPAVMVVEDLPHGLGFTGLLKDVCRLQGRIFDRMDAHVASDDMLFLAPAEWRKTYDGMGRGTGPDVVVEVAARYGYHPPLETLLKRAKGNGGKTRANKVATDYCSAYLIARWAIDTKIIYGTYDIVGTSRYRTRAIKKSDFRPEGDQ